MTDRRAIRSSLHLVLAHHPLCSNFAPDIYRLGPLRFCRGCAVALPAFVLGAVLLFSLLRAGAAPPLLMGSGLVLALPQLATYLRRFSTTVRALAKAAGGIGLAFVVGSLFALGWPTWLLVGALTTMAGAFLVLQLLRARSILATCRRCPWAMDWDRCPGFGGI